MDEKPFDREQALAEARAAGQIITTICIWSLDMVMVFDQRGVQIPAYQGSFDEVMSFLRADAPLDARWRYGRWKDICDPERLRQYHRKWCSARFSQMACICGLRGYPQS